MRFNPQTKRCLTSKITRETAQLLTASRPMITVAAAAKSRIKQIRNHLREKHVTMKERLQEVKIEKERRDLLIEAETEARREVVETGIVSVITEAVVIGIVVGTVVIEENVVVETVMMTTAEAAVTVITIGVEMIEEIDAVIGLVLAPRIDPGADHGLDLHLKPSGSVDSIWHLQPLQC